MARGPHRRSIRDEWIYFFVGTPPRFLWTFVGLYVAFAAAAPDLAAAALSNVLDALARALGPVLAPLVQIGIAGLGLWVMFRPLTAKKKKGDH